MVFPIFKNTKRSGRILTFILLVVFGLAFTLVVAGVISLLTGKNVSETGMIWISQVCTQIIAYMFPPLAFAALLKEKPLQYLGFNKIPLWGLLGILAIITIIPFVDFVAVWNEGFTLPESMSGLEEQYRKWQDEADEVSNKMLSVNTLAGFIINLMIFGLFAAVSEELLFRSVIQPFFVRVCKNAYLGILITAIIFSAVHFEFYGFIPRVLLGFMLGYMYYLTGSILVPMLMHFLNNAIMVVFFYLNANNIVSVDVNHLGSCGTFGTILSLVVTVAILFVCHRLSKRDLKAMDM